MFVVAALAGAGCFAAPESCIGCRGDVIDAGVDHGNTADHPSGAGGSLDARGSGGATGTGGTPTGTGGTPSGAGGAPTGTGGRPTGTGGTPTGAGGATPGTGGTPTGTGGTPTGTGGAIGVGGATGAGGATGVGGMTGTGGVVVIDPDLVAWYKFDETTGTSASDSSGHARTATLTPTGGGTAAFSTTRQVGTASLNLASTTATAGGFVVMPASLSTMGATTAVSITCWVNVRTARIWQRIFDFGSSSTTTYMFLSSQQAMLTPNSLRFAITTNGNASEQVIDMTTRAAFGTGAWRHVAVVLAAGATGNYTGTLYLDKVAVGTNTAMNLRPSDLGNTTNNWIGRSQFAADTLFDGQIDDFRIYKRALTAAEITALP